LDRIEELMSEIDLNLHDFRFEFLFDVLILFSV